MFDYCIRLVFNKASLHFTLFSKALAEQVFILLNTYQTSIKVIEHVTFQTIVSSLLSSSLLRLVPAYYYAMLSCSHIC